MAPDVSTIMNYSQGCPKFSLYHFKSTCTNIHTFKCQRLNINRVNKFRSHKGTRLHHTGMCCIFSCPLVKYVYNKNTFSAKLPNTINSCLQNRDEQYFLYIQNLNNSTLWLYYIMCICSFIQLLLDILDIYFGWKEQASPPIWVHVVFFSSLVKTLISVWIAVWYFPGNFRSSLLVNISLSNNPSSLLCEENNNF